ncbi:MAG: metallophosphoesterase [Oscillospiraceae bacterium]|nr:metallophosphoesterase [Oscillospiraceae bacterium]
MSIFAIADTHLSLGVKKPMDIFNGWQGYEKRLEENWRLLVKDTDTVVLPGDISWGMTMPQALPDLQFLDRLPGQKIILKGNHDYWWPTRAKMDAFFEQNSITTIRALFHDAVLAEGKALCGTRSWFYEQDEPDEKVFLRELGRLRMSLEEAKKLEAEEIIAFLHYPPLYQNFRCEEIISLLKEYGVTRCFYGHIHGPSIQYAFQGESDGIEFKLVSADSLRFVPYKIG